MIPFMLEPRPLLLPTRAAVAERVWWPVMLLQDAVLCSPAIMAVVGLTKPDLVSVLLLLLSEKRRCLKARESAVP
jgi:hypothetical protein